MSELGLQKFTANLLQLQAAPGVIWFHPPNGEARSGRTGAKLKAMGVRPGVADIVIVLPGGKAAFLELKTDKGSLSNAQLSFLDLCAANGAPYVVAKSPEDVEATLRAWGALRGRPSERRAA